MHSGINFRHDLRPPEFNGDYGAPTDNCTKTTAPGVYVRHWTKATMTEADGADGVATMVAADGVDGAVCSLLAAGWCDGEDDSGDGGDDGNGWTTAAMAAADGADGAVCFLLA